MELGMQEVHLGEHLRMTKREEAGFSAKGFREQLWSGTCEKHGLDGKLQKILKLLQLEAGSFLKG